MEHCNEMKDEGHKGDKRENSRKRGWESKVSQYWMVLNLLRFPAE
jgi:hypothetical protein